MACGILVPWPEIEHMSPALGAQGLNHRMVRGVPLSSFFDHLIFGTAKCSRLFLFSPCSNPGVSYFSKKLWHLFIYLENYIYRTKSVKTPLPREFLGGLVVRSILKEISPRICLKMYITVLWTLWERERVGRFGRMALKHVKYHVWNEKKKFSFINSKKNSSNFMYPSFYFSPSEIAIRC